MDAFWAFLIVLAVVFFLFVILPNILRTPIQANAQAYHPRLMDPQEQQRTAEDKEREASRQMLDGYYEPARESVPEDYPVKFISDCPYSKPPSTDLPIVDVPMCVAVRKNNMKLA
jgi:hypothetical protein